MTPVLRVGHLRKSYRGVDAVRDISFEVRDGEIYGLIGPNGSGKSTTLHALVDIIQPTSGCLEVCGHRASTIRAKQLFGFVPDDLDMPETLSGGEFLAFIRRLYGVTDTGRMDALIEIFGLREALHRLIEEYSHGMKKKLQITASLLHYPRALILDEPFRGLDPEAAISLKRLLSIERARGTGLLAATHDLSMAQRYCDRIGIISGGDLVAEGAVPELLGRFDTDSLEEVFLRASGLLDKRSGLEEHFGHL
ncbi:MAG TPA: ABC transporter ATP-binding protein [Rubrobacteraceae bacterium]|nr:ABC transporter ATP-binding protein [Rubrobacteraceae bacterium]